MTTRKTTTTKKNAALILLAAGSSQRMSGCGKKEFLSLKDGTVLSEAALAFLKTKLFCIVAVACPKNAGRLAKEAFYKNPAVSELSQDVDVFFVTGGNTRQQSVLKALAAIERRAKTQARHSNAQARQNAASAKTPRMVLIHDGARPFLTPALVKKTYQATLKNGAAVPALEPVETQKEIDSSCKIARHLKRSSLAAVQTPQGFLFPEILKFHKKAAKSGEAFTDDTEIWDEYSAKKTRVILGEPDNIKITYPKDLGADIFDAPKKKRIKALSPETPAPSFGAAPKIRVGLGTDLHRLVKGRPLILGGVKIPFKKGEDGHSDGDALLHAITDALLGAAAKGDIGSYFPPSDPKWKNADSKKLLAAAWNDVCKAGWRLVNLDCVVHLQEPKFLPHRERVVKSIARVLGVDPKLVFVKAKTGERIGPVGIGEVVETKAVCLLSN